MSRIIAFDYITCLFILLLQFIFLSFTAAQNDIIHGMIRDGNQEIHLKWKKTKQLLANHNLPIWIATMQKRKSCESTMTTVHTLQENFIMKNVGEFTMYHDEKKSSAVIYFKQTGTLHGIISTRYVITNLPINECNNGHEAGGHYIIRIRNDVHEDIKPLDLSIPHYEESTSQNPESHIPDQLEPSRKRQRIDDQRITTANGPVITLYPEILLFVSNDVMRHIQANYHNNFLPVIIKHYLIFFNSVDMLFSKLSTKYIKIHLNLAGIVIEGQKDVFTFMKTLEGSLTGGEYDDFRYIDINITLRSIPEYINANRDTFPEDSFDFYFITTRSKLWVTEIYNWVPGISGTPNIYAGRKLRNPTRKLIGTAVHQGSPTEFTIAGHEIAHLMSIGHDSLSAGYRSDRTQCYAIMSIDGKYCEDCLKWSDQSIKDLKKFARDNRNRCFLLNKPRSLYPRGYRMKTLSPLDQCYCYGFESRFSYSFSDYLSTVSEDACDKDIICGHGHRRVNAILPVDGTPCNNNKVCWNKICQEISDTAQAIL